MMILNTNWGNISFSYQPKMLHTGLKFEVLTTEGNELEHFSQNNQLSTLLSFAFVHRYLKHVQAIL